jgi:hypothetical protein
MGGGKDDLYDNAMFIGQIQAIFDVSDRMGTHPGAVPIRIPSQIPAKQKGVPAHGGGADGLKVHNLSFHLGMVVPGKLTTAIRLVVNHAGKEESSPGAVVYVQLRSIHYYREPVRWKWNLGK